jgi:hypothetical protein
MPDQNEILAAIEKAQADIDMSEHGATYAPVHPTVFLAMFNAAFEGYFGVTPEVAAEQSAAARATPESLAATAALDKATTS